MLSETSNNLIIRDLSVQPQNGISKCAENQLPILSSEPLWKRAPTRDLKGKPYADFMMLIPGLRSFEPPHLRNIVNKLEAVLKHFEDDIILADLNLKINILWVTMQAHPGLTAEIAALIHHVVPEAKLVSQHRAP